jgi:hypothetical protein
MKFLKIDILTAEEKGSDVLQVTISSNWTLYIIHLIKKNEQIILVQKNERPCVKQNRCSIDCIDKRCQIHECDNQKPKVELKTSWRSQHRHPNDDVVWQYVYPKYAISVSGLVFPTRLGHLESRFDQLKEDECQMRKHTIFMENNKAYIIRSYILISLI